MHQLSRNRDILSRWLWGYLSYLLVYCGIVVAVALWAPAVIGEPVARSGLLHTVACVAPGGRFRAGPWRGIVSVFTTALIGYSVFAGFAWFTYGFLGLNSKGPAPLPMVAASLGVIVVGVVAATFVGRKIFAEFRSF